MTDAQVMDAALKVGLDIPEGYYYLGDAGYPLSSDKVLPPYRGVQYHLAEWTGADQKLVHQLVLHDIITHQFLQATEQGRII